MITDIAPVSKINQMLMTATKPAETKAIESMAQAAKAYAKEQGDYEGVVRAVRVYIMARMKTTELIQPHIRQGQHGREGNNVVTFLSDLGFTKMQWSRRTKELKIKDRLDEYFDECLSNGWEPSLHGFLNYTTKAHVSHNSGENEWYTPPEYVEAAREVMGTIDTDPASCDEANETVKAENYYTEEENGLVKVWGGNVWMNPPYSQPLISEFADTFAKKYNAGEFQQACVLVNNATETNWYQSLLTYAAAVCFVKGRVKFIDRNGDASGAPLQGQTILYFGSNEKAFANKFSEFGIILYGRGC
jgi:phage N-6-adenine-methyltransferase